MIRRKERCHSGVTVRSKDQNISTCFRKLELVLSTQDNGHWYIKY